jgi:hypothetical protein
MKEPRSKDDWEEIRRRNHGGKGYFCFDRKLYNSEAFKELSKKPKHVLVLLCALNQLWQEKEDKSAKNRRKFRNGGRVHLVQNELKERHGLANATIAEAKKRLVELGFLDVVEVGDVFNAGVFCFSYRWEEYPLGDYRPKDERPAGKLAYPDNSLKNPDHPINRARQQKKREQEKTSMQELNVESIQEMNVSITPPIQQLNEESMETWNLPIQ